MPGFRLLAVTVIGLAGLLLGDCRAQGVVVAPNRIGFAQDTDTALPTDNPPSRQVQIGAPVGVPRVRFKLRDVLIEKSPGDPQGQTNFVIVSPSSGVAEPSLGTASAALAIFTIALNPKVVPYMTSGVYSLIVRFDDADASPPAEPPGGVIVTLVLGGAQPTIASVSNAASLQPGISPGQLVTIRGGRLSTPPLMGDPDPTGLFPKVLGNTAVTFNGISAPLLYVSNDQVNCVVPYALAGSRSAEVIVKRVHPSGVERLSAPVIVPVSDSNPAIFTADQSGSGPAVALNTGASGGLNSESNPAPKGSTITFYATGAGLWNFAFPDGGLDLTPRVFPFTPLYRRHRCR